MTVPSHSKDSNDSRVSASGEDFGVKSKFIAKRRETVQEIWKVIEKYCVVLVHGTPCSGKSTLGYLVARHARKRLKEPYDTVLISPWRPNPGEAAATVLREACTKQLPMRTFDQSITQRRVLFIIDDAQTTYSDTDLWNIYLKQCSNGNTPAKFLLLARYGSTSKWKNELPMVTLWQPISSQQVFLRPPSLPNYPNISISFNITELTDAVRQHEREFNKHRLTNDAIEALFNVSSGHAGLVRSLLGIVFDEHEASFREDSIAEINAEAFMLYISDTPALLMKICQRVVKRSLIWADSFEGFQLEHRDLVKRILEQGPVIYDRNDENHAFLYQHGICQGHMERVRWHLSKPHEIISVVKVTPDSVAENTTYVGMGIWEGERIILVFPTEIHAR